MAEGEAAPPARFGGARRPDGRLDGRLLIESPEVAPRGCTRSAVGIDR